MKSPVELLFERYGWAIDLYLYSRIAAVVFGLVIFVLVVRHGYKEHKEAKERNKEIRERFKRR